MIISCPSCKKSFQIDDNLIPLEGRNLKCGSCDHVWFFKNEKKNLELKKEIIFNNEIERDEKVQKKNDVSKKNLPDKVINNKDKALIKYEERSKITLTNLLGYMIVFIFILFKKYIFNKSHSVIFPHFFYNSIFF